MFSCLAAQSGFYIFAVLVQILAVSRQTSEAAAVSLPKLPPRRAGPAANDTNGAGERLEKRAFNGPVDLEFTDIRSVLEDEADAFGKLKAETQVWIKDGKTYMDLLWFPPGCNTDYGIRVSSLIYEWTRKESLYTPEREWIVTPVYCHPHTDSEYLLSVSIGVLETTSVAYVFLLDFSRGKIFVEDLDGKPAMGAWSHAAVAAWNLYVAEVVEMFNGRYPVSQEIVGLVDLTPLTNTFNARRLFAEYAAVLNSPVEQWKTLSAVEQDLIVLGFMGSDVRRGFSTMCFGYANEIGRKTITQMRLQVDMSGGDKGPYYSVEMRLDNLPGYIPPRLPTQPSGVILPSSFPPVKPSKPSSLRGSPITSTPMP